MSTVVQRQRGAHTMMNANQNIAKQVGLRRGRVLEEAFVESGNATLVPTPAKRVNGAMTTNIAKVTYAMWKDDQDARRRAMLSNQSQGMRANQLVHQRGHCETTKAVQRQHGASTTTSASPDTVKQEELRRGRVPEEVFVESGNAILVTTPVKPANGVMTTNIVYQTHVS